MLAGSFSMFVVGVCTKEIEATINRAITEMVDGEFILFIYFFSRASFLEFLKFSHLKIIAFPGVVMQRKNVYAPVSSGILSSRSETKYCK